MFRYQSLAHALTQPMTLSLEAIGTMGHGPWDLGTWSLEAIGTLGHGPGDLGTLPLQAIGTMGPSPREHAHTTRFSRRVSSART